MGITKNPQRASVLLCGLQERKSIEGANQRWQKQLQSSLSRCMDHLHPCGIFYSFNKTSYSLCYILCSPSPSTSLHLSFIQHLPTYPPLSCFAFPPSCLQTFCFVHHFQLSKTNAMKPNGMFAIIMCCKRFLPYFSSLPCIVSCLKQGCLVLFVQGAS